MGWMRIKTNANITRLKNIPKLYRFVQYLGYLCIDKFQSMFRKTLRILTNRYLVATIAFGIWIIFFDNYSLIRQYKLRKDLKGLQEMKLHYRSQIEKNERELKELVTNKKTLEKFAREKYLMKRDNEDIYIVVEEE